MSGSPTVIGDILRASPEARERIINACTYLKFQGDDKIILDAIENLPGDFDYTDLYLVLPVSDRNRLISKCIEQDNKTAAKEYISELRTRGDTECLGLFKQFLKEK